jgi:hypothetical protein
MGGELADGDITGQRRHAALLQAYLRQRAPARFHLRLSDLRRAAQHTAGEIGGGADPLELLLQAWGHLILTGLVTPDPAADGFAWRLADTPAGRPSLGAVVAAGEGQA